MLEQHDHSPSVPEVVNVGEDIAKAFCDQAMEEGGHQQKQATSTILARCSIKEKSIFLARVQIWK